MKPRPRRIIYMGTPDFAVPPLEALIHSSRYRPLAVVTREDKASGRGHKLQKPPVKLTAEQANIPVHQPIALKRGKLASLLAFYEPELIITAAYGRILPDDVLDLPDYGCINIHASLLPKYRGASPIHAAILEGDDTAGVTFMQMTQGMDEGDILEQVHVPLTPKHTAEQLFNELSELSAMALIPFLDRFFAGEITPVPQDHQAATYVTTLTRDDGALNFAMTTDEIDRQVRGLYSWPGAFAFYKGKRLKVLSGEPLGTDEISDFYEAKPGAIVMNKGRFVVKTGDGFYEILRYQPAGSRILEAAEGAHNLELNEILRESPEA